MLHLMFRLGSKNRFCLNVGTGYVVLVVKSGKAEKRLALWCQWVSMGTVLFDIYHLLDVVNQNRPF